MQPKGKDKKIQASADVMNMWKTAEGRLLVACASTAMASSGEKLKELIKEHGDFATVECEVSKWQKTTMLNQKQGEWVWKSTLTVEYGWKKSGTWFIGHVSFIEINIIYFFHIPQGYGGQVL